MATITLAQAWTYRTPMVTINYGAGTHEVPDIVQTAAIDAGVTETDEGTDNGDRNSTPRPPRAARKA
ncbi:hypothetical protein [Novosphingobium sp.]|uniref:hypothetical protein n=1 Tax=Novosphingobium sp. TaxID=1874826 RepID=UPI00286DED80|nr:hypothetical protein [Novosphingobium sp.]